MSNFEFSVPCLFGLEGLAGDELRRLDIENVRVENGRVLFSGDERALAKANICLRTGERVLLTIADFKATTFEQLFQGCICFHIQPVVVSHVWKTPLRLPWQSVEGTPHFQCREHRFNP